MARIQYQQSQGKGWSNIDPGYISLSRMREKQREDEQGEDRRLQEEKQRNAQAEANVERIQKATEANLKEINIESKVSQTQEAALRVNKGIAEQNFNAETSRNKVKSTLETLIEFAPSALQAKQKMDQADWDVTAKAATEYYLTHGLDDSRKLRMDLLEDLTWKKGYGFELEADKMSFDGYTPPEVMWTRHRNKAVDYGLLKARSIKAGNDYKAVLQSALLKNGITDPSEQDAFTQAFQIEYLKANGLYTKDGKAISADFLGPMYEKMSNARSNIINRSTLNKALTDAQSHAGKYQTIAATNLSNKSDDILTTLESINNYRDRLQNTPTDIYGTKPTEAVVRNQLLEFVVNSTDPAYAEKILKAMPYEAGGQKSNMWDANKLQISKLLKQKKADDEIRRGLEAQADLAQQTSEFDQFDADIKSGAIPTTKEALDEKFSEWRSKEYDQSIIQERFGHLTEETPAGSQDGNVYLQDAWEKIDDITATVEDLTNPKLPKNAFTQEQIAEVSKNQELLKVADYEGNFKENIDNALHNLLATKAVKEKGQKMDISLANAQEGARKMFSKCIIGGDDKNTCHKQLTDELEKEDGLFEKKQYGDDDQEKGRKGQPESYFANFTFKAEQESKISADHFPLNTKEKFNMFVELSDDETIVTKSIVISPDYVKAFAKRVERGFAYDYHPVAVEMSRLHPDKYPEPHDFIREQAYLMDKAGLLGAEGLKEGNLNLKTLRRAWGEKAEDPLVSHKIMSALTNTDLKKGLVLAADPSITRAPVQMSPVVQEAYARLTERLLNPETSEDYPLFGLENHPYNQEYNLTW